MRDELKRIYENLYTDFSDTGGYWVLDGLHRRSILDIPRDQGVMGTIKASILEFESEGSPLNSQVEIRADAKFFISLIFYSMVYLPIREENFASNNKNVEDYIKKDVRFLLTEAIDQKRFAEVKEVTAHTILSLLDQKWEMLNISKGELWNK
jgi:hypothetical protein